MAPNSTFLDFNIIVGIPFNIAIGKRTLSPRPTSLVAADALLKTKNRPGSTALLIIKLQAQRIPLL